MATPLDNTQLIAQALGLRPVRVNRLAVELKAVGGLFGLLNAGSESLDGILKAGERTRLDAILSLARALQRPCALSPPIETAASVAAYFGPRLAYRAAEHFWVLMLDGRGRWLAEAQVAEGTLTTCLVHPREVFAPALRARAASIIAVHNHPSGDPEPSDEDQALTLRLIDAGQILGIPLIDHIVVARSGFRSLGGFISMR